MLFFTKWVSNLKKMFARQNDVVEVIPEVEVLPEPELELPALPAVEVPVNEEPAKVKPPRKSSSAPKKRAINKKAPVTLDVTESTDSFKSASTKKKPNIKIVK